MPGLGHLRAIDDVRGMPAHAAYRYRLVRPPKSREGSDPERLRVEAISASKPRSAPFGVNSVFRTGAPGDSNLRRDRGRLGALMRPRGVASKAGCAPAQPD